MSRTERCDGCGREVVATPDRSSSLRLQLKQKVQDRTGGIFGRCDPLNAAVLGAAVAVPLLGAGVVALVCLALAVLLIVILW